MSAGQEQKTQGITKILKGTNRKWTWKSEKPKETGEKYNKTQGFCQCLPLIGLSPDYPNKQMIKIKKDSRRLTRETGWNNLNHETKSWQGYSWTRKTIVEYIKSSWGQPMHRQDQWDSSEGGPGTGRAVLEFRNRPNRWGRSVIHDLFWHRTEGDPKGLANHVIRELWTEKFLQMVQKAMEDLQAALALRRRFSWYWLFRELRRRHPIQSPIKHPNLCFRCGRQSFCQSHSQLPSIVWTKQEV